MTQLPSPRVVWTPAAISRLADEDLARAACVVIDVLRATTSAVTALAHGATAVIPVAGVEEARRLRAEKFPDALLIGERGGLPPVGFDLGNSPRDLTPERVAGRRIVHTTTNGTAALRACACAGRVFAGCFRNLPATATALRAAVAEGFAPVLVCAGTESDFSLEDALFAGALCEALGMEHAARHIWRGRDRPLADALARSANGRRLHRLGLGADVLFCAETGVAGVLAEMDAETGLVGRALED